MEQREDKNLEPASPVASRLKAGKRINSHKFRFGIGDTVFVIRMGQKREWRPCWACDGSRKVQVKEREITCPECYGRGGENFTLPPEITADPMPYTVGQIRVAITSSPGLDDSIFDNYKAQEKTEEEYMLVETGIGNGSLWSMDKLAGSYEEAVAMAEARKAVTP